MSSITWAEQRKKEKIRINISSELGPSHKKQPRYKDLTIKGDFCTPSKHPRIAGSSASLIEHQFLRLEDSRGKDFNNLTQTPQQTCYLLYQALRPHFLRFQTKLGIPKLKAFTAKLGFSKLTIYSCDSLHRAQAPPVKHGNILVGHGQDVHRWADYALRVLILKKKNTFFMRIMSH